MSAIVLPMVHSSELTLTVRVVKWDMIPLLNISPHSSCPPSIARFLLRQLWPSGTDWISGLT